MKYIDANLLRKEVKRLEKTAHKSALGCADSETRKFHEGKDFAYQHVGVLIDSLQQEQPDFPTTDEQMKEFLATHPKVEVPDKYKTPDWLFKKQEQPEVFDTAAFQKGVQEGRRLEREDALTIADIEKLHTFIYAVKNNKQGAFTFTRLSDEQYEEVLRRFNNSRKEE